jgi:hypothetical protein
VTSQIRRYRSKTAALVELNRPGLGLSDAHWRTMVLVGPSVSLPGLVVGDSLKRVLFR